MGLVFGHVNLISAVKPNHIFWVMKYFYIYLLYCKSKIQYFYLAFKTSYQIHFCQMQLQELTNSVLKISDLHAYQKKRLVVIYYSGINLPVR